MAQGPDETRRAALALLAGVLTEGRPLSDLRGPLLAPLPEAGRARAQRLAAQTLRRIGRADAVLDPVLRKRPPMPVRNILRLATVELHGEGAAPHGVVSDAVAQARADRATMHHAGLVNAVLRRVAERPAAAWESLPPQRLPGWLRGRLDAAWGRPAVAAMEAAHEAGAAHDLTPRDGDGAALAAALGGTLLPTGSVRLPGRVAISALPGYAEGAWWVQDAGAAIAARALAPRPGERVLDLCAAPGGKTLQLAAAGAEVTALDVSAERMALLEANLARTRLAAETVVADAHQWSTERPYDAVLLDAPCTATGTIRRHPDLPFTRDGGGVSSLAEGQAALLDASVARLRPGGRLVFCVCSLLPEEGEKQLARALERHPALAPDDAPLSVEGVPEAWRAPGGGLRLRPDFWPELGGIDGFFIAALRKRPDAAA